MIEYLEQLVAKKQYIDALSFAERLLMESESSVDDMLRIHECLQISRLRTGEHMGSLVSGALVLKLATDLEDWDKFGVACLNFSAASIYLGKYQDAISHLFDYLTNIQKLGPAREHEWKIWYNLGIAYGQLGRGEEACDALLRALEIVKSALQSRNVHSVRHALIGAYIVAGDYGPVPCILAQCAKYLRSSTGEDIFESRLWHLVLRTQFAVRTGRYHRAYCVARRGLQVAEGRAEFVHRFHLLIARVLLAKESPKESLRHALTARVYAIQIKRYDLESEASEFMYDIAKKNPEAVEGLPPAFAPVSADGTPQVYLS